MPARTKQTIAEVIKCMAERHASGIPVVEPDRKLCGIVTEGKSARRQSTQLLMLSCLALGVWLTNTYRPIRVLSRTS
jgi:CBS-domain-containing membrane protein